MTLRYRGKGRFIAGVPTTDLTLGDLERLVGPEAADELRARLIASGLYVEDPDKPAKPVKEDPAHV